MFKPATCYTLSMKEWKDFWKFLKSVKFPDGYVANISWNVNMKDKKITELKTYDCHVLLQWLLPIGLRVYLKKKVIRVIIILPKDMCKNTIGKRLGCFARRDCFHIM